jgi:stress-induced morphogen
MAIEKDVLESILSESFPDAKINLIDLLGDKDHYSLEIKSQQFAGKSRLEQHKIVNLALKKHLGTTLHALTIKTSS